MVTWHFEKKSILIQQVMFT